MLLALAPSYSSSSLRLHTFAINAQYHGLLKGACWLITSDFSLSSIVNNNVSYLKTTVISNFYLCLQWFPEVKHHCPKTPIVLVGTKTDLRKDSNTSTGQNVSTAEGLSLKKQLGACKYLECSALTQKGVHSVFEEAVRAALAPEPITKEKKCHIL